MTITPATLKACLDELNGLTVDLFRSFWFERLSEEDAQALLNMLTNARLFVAEDGDNPGQRALLAAYQGDDRASDRQT